MAKKKGNGVRGLGAIPNILNDRFYCKKCSECEKSVCAAWPIVPGWCTQESPGKAAKKACHMKAIDFPPYSPDLNPLDYFLWNDVLSRMDRNEPKQVEGKAAYAKRLRLTALRTSPVKVTKALEGMKVRIKQIWEADGGDIERD